MKAVMMNPAVPVRETSIVDCDSHGKFEEVGKRSDDFTRSFTGDMGGRTIITKELWEFVHEHAKTVAAELMGRLQRTGSGRLLPTKSEVIDSIVSDLKTGAYNNEYIELAPSTVEKILGNTYQFLLKAGAPPTETSLIKREEERERYQEETLQRSKVRDESRKLMAQIYGVLSVEPIKIRDAFEAQSVRDVKAVFGRKVDWPDGDYTADDMKELISTALELRVKRVREKPLRYARPSRSRRASMEEAEFETSRMSGEPWIEE